MKYLITHSLYWTFESWRFALYRRHLAGCTEDVSRIAKSKATSRHFQDIPGQSNDTIIAFAKFVPPLTLLFHWCEGRGICDFIINIFRPYYHSSQIINSLRDRLPSLNTHRHIYGICYIPHQKAYRAFLSKWYCVISIPSTAYRLEPTSMWLP